MAITKIQSESLNLADTYDFTGTVTGAGESNTPVFCVRKSGDHTGISAATYTKVTGWSTIFDPDSKFSDNKFTPGETGRYLIVATAYMSHIGNSHSRLAIYLNGSAIEEVQYTPGSNSQTPQNIVCVANVTSSSDYIEVYVHQPSGSAGTVYSSGIKNQFSGFKIT